MDFFKKLKLANNGDVHQRGTPLGAGLNTTDLDYMVARGMGYAVTVGAFSTGVAGGGASAVIDLDRPNVAIGVPSGKVIRPLRLSAQLQVGLFAADNDESEILFAVDSLGLWPGDGTYTVEEPSNLRTDLGKGSGCRCGSVFTADMNTTPIYGAAADPVLDLELARAVETSDIFSTGTGILIKRLDLLYEPRVPPFLVGPCTLLGYFGGTIAAVGGFMQLQWVEGTLDQFLL